MKRKILIALALCLALTLTACDGTTTSGGDSGNSQQNTESGDKLPTNSQGGVDSNEKLPTISQDGKISETVLYDQNNVKITANELSYKNDNAVLSVTVENNSSKKLEFYSGTALYCCNSVNGYMIPDGYMNCELEAGASETKEIQFSFYNLSLYGITEIADIEVGFCIDDDDKEVYTGPLGVKTQLAGGYNYGKDTYLDTVNSKAALNTYKYEVIHFGQDAEYNDNGVKLISNALLKNKDGRYMLFAEFENTSDKDVMLGISDIMLNNLSSGNTYGIDYITAGKRCVSTIALYNTFEDEYLNIFGINEFGNIKMTMYQTDMNNNTLADEKTAEIKISGKNESINSDGTVIYDNNGIKIISKGIIPSPSESNDDLDLMLLIENNSEKDVWLGDDYNDPLVNGKETNSYSFYVDIKANSKRFKCVTLMDNSLKENGITSPEDIKTVEWVMTVNSDNNKLDEVKVKIEF